MKTCQHCNKQKPLADFPQDKRRKDGVYPYCRVCHVLKQKKYKSQRVEGELNGKLCAMCLTPVRGHLNRVYCRQGCRDRAASLKKKFNLSPEDYRMMLDACGGLCPICRSKTMKWAVDHDHTTGEVTAPVCTRCNVGLLAYSNHDAATAQRLADFLRNPPTRQVLGRMVIANMDYIEAQGRPSGIHTMWGKRNRKEARKALNGQ